MLQQSPLHKSTMHEGYVSLGCIGTQENRHVGKSALKAITQIVKSNLAPNKF